MRGIEFEVVWFDHDVIEFKVTCSNGSFCGSTRMYLAHDGLSDAADTLSGFPSTIQDTRRVSLGAPEPSFAGGGIDMTFRCVDSAGHAVVLVSLTADYRKSLDTPQSVSLHIPVEAGSVDSFVAKARLIETKNGAKAYLQMADHTVGWVQRGFTL